MYKKILYGIAGVSGASVVTWRTLFPWIGHDIQFIKTGMHLMKEMNADKESGKFVIDKFEDKVAEHPKKPFIIFEENVYSYEFVDSQANRIANIAKNLGLKHGDCVAIVIGNEPSFVWTFLGLQKLGITLANINFHLRSNQLVHAILASEAKAIIVGSGEDLFMAIDDDRAHLKNIPIFIQGKSASQLPEGYTSLDDLMNRSLPVPVDKSARSEMTAMSTCCYIYTSGTTGLPKAVYISQGKAATISVMMHIVKLEARDRLYIVLPLYHSSGGGLGFMGVIHTGCTMVLRRKFSARHFWEDCRRYKVTVFQYIGELCRYILAQPESPLDTVHNVRAMFGNGLRKDIWEKFQTRFKIPVIGEFFGATEGPAMTFSTSNKPGAIGRMSPFLSLLEPFKKHLVKYDFTTAEPLRDKNGRCVDIASGEKGLFLSEVPKEYIDAFGTVFYKSTKEANEKKIVRNAFVDGDIYFNYGDVFFLDKNYFLYFADRIGDTFRWKGENVSTTDVANILTSLDFIHDANVYGVTVQGHDGRAGMAAITLYDSDDVTPQQLSAITKHCDEDLPSYSRPFFLRIQKEAHETATFKQRKVDLVRDGFDPSKTDDPLYFYETERKQYIPITPELYAQLQIRSKL